MRSRHKLAPWADSKAIKAIYARAATLTEETGIPHEVDHIYPVGPNKHVCGLHVENNLRVVTKAENITKGNRLPGSEAHELAQPFSFDVHYAGETFRSRFHREQVRGEQRRSYEQRLWTDTRRRAYRNSLPGCGSGRLRSASEADRAIQASVRRVEVARRLRGAEAAEMLQKTPEIG